MAGWIKLHRKILKWEWYSHLNTRAVFIHCLLRANYEDTTWRGIHLKRGQFIASIETLTEEVGITTKQVRTALSNLKRTGEVTTEGRTQFSVITITEYECWQGEDEQEGKETGKQKVTKTATDKEVKNIRSKNIFPFRKHIVDLGVEDKIVDQWLAVRKNKRLTNSEAAFEELEVQINIAKTRNVTATDCIRMAVVKSWGGFKYAWYEKEITGAGTIFGQPVAGTTEFNPKGKHVK